jgi:anti-sigma factor RsiW
MPQPPSDHDLLALLALGELSAEDAEALRARMQSDPKSQAAFERLEQAARFLQAESGTEPSAAALARAKRLLREARPGVLDRLSDGVRRIVAGLDFDTRLTPAVAGIRGAGGTAQVAFSSEVADLDLEITPATEDTWTVAGQVDADEGGDWRITIVDDAGMAPDLTIDASDGAFRTRLPPGSYELRLRMGDVEITASPLRIP